MKDRYMDLSETVARLMREYKEHKSLLVAFDFDNTVYDYHSTGDTFPKMENLLRTCKKVGFKLILFTSNEGQRLNKVVKYCSDQGYSPDYINESPVMKTTKPYYNILLDDRSGLYETYNTLVMVIQQIERSIT